MVNSNDFRREFDKKFKIKSKCIYNPFYKTKLNMNSNKSLLKKKLFKNFINWKINQTKRSYDITQSYKIN